MANPKPHFFKVFFPNQSSSRLRIPPGFWGHIEDESNRKVCLRGPSGDFWKVDLVKSRDGFCFEGGWESFIIDHSLVMGDFLIFRYDGNSKFRVFVLDSTACEKSKAFTAKSSIEDCDDDEEELEEEEEEEEEEEDDEEEEEEEEENRPLALFRKRTVEEKLRRKTEIDDFSVLNVYKRKKKHALLKPSLNNTTDISLNSGSLIIPKEEEKSYSTFSYIEHSRGTATEGTTKSLHKCSALPVSKSEPCLFKKSTSKKRGLVNCDEESKAKRRPRVKSYISQRRLVTKEEMNRTYARAMLFKSDNPYVVSVMQDAYVYSSLFMWIPTWFADKYMPKENTVMTVWDPDGKPWKINYIAYSNHGAFSGGWGKFSFAQNLEKGDICVFELIEKTQLKVHVYRVVEEITPLLRRGSRQRMNF